MPGAGLVDAVVLLHVGDFFGAEFAHHLAHADDQRVIGNDAAFGNNGPGAHQAVATDHSVVQHNSLHADQGALMDGAAVEHGLVPHGDTGADGHRAAFVHVGRGVAAAESSVGAGACAGIPRDVAGAVGAVGDIEAGVGDGRVVVGLLDGHAAGSGSGQPCMPACASPRWRGTLRRIVP